MAETEIATHTLSMIINSRLRPKYMLNKPCSEFVLISKQANCFQLPAYGMLKILSDKKEKKIQYQKLLPENYYM